METDLTTRLAVAVLVFVAVFLLGICNQTMQKVVKCERQIGELEQKVELLEKANVGNH